MPNPLVRKRLACGDSALRHFLLFFTGKFSREAVSLLGCEKFGVRRSVGQQKIRDNAAHEGGNTLQNQQPPPTAESKPMNVIQNHPRKWSADYAGYRST